VSRLDDDPHHGQLGPRTQGIRRQSYGLHIDIERIARRVYDGTVFELERRGHGFARLYHQALGYENERRRRQRDGQEFEAEVRGVPSLW
jgi:hypothetical protein